MSNLVIGNTSQLSHYFPLDYVRVSSKEIDFDQIKKTKWEKIFLCFGESRKFIGNPSIYDEVNYSLTLSVIEKLYEYSNYFFVYSTCELWNKYSGQISLDMPFDFYNTSYIESKYKITKHILSSGNYSKVKILYPFNFNSIYRSKDFLFGKIFHSIINEVEIEIGDTYFYRDIIHPKFVVSESINTNEDKIIGSGRLVFIDDFISDLYKNYGLDSKILVKRQKNSFQEYIKREEYYLKSEECKYSYNELLQDTILDINKIKK